MTKTLKLAAIATTTLAFAACTTSGNIERNAAYGAAGGAAVGGTVGAVSGDVKVGEGAAVGALIGAVGGAIVGSQQDNRQYGGTTRAPNLDRSQGFIDPNNGRTYFYERGTSRTFYSNGQFRSN